MWYVRAPMSSQMILVIEPPLLPAGSHLLAALFVEITTLLSHLGLAQLLGWGILLVAHLDEGKQSIQMPFLTFERDAQRDHPIVDHLGRDDFSASRLGVVVAKPSSCHLGVDVLVDRVDVLHRQLGEYTGMRLAL